MRASSRGNTVGNTMLSTSACRSAHSVVASSHQSRKVLRCQLPCPLGSDVWVLCPDLRLILIDLVGNGGWHLEALRHRPSTRGASCHLHVWACMASVDGIGTIKLCHHGLGTHESLLTDPVRNSDTVNTMHSIHPINTCSIDSVNPVHTIHGIDSINSIHAVNHIRGG